MPSYYIRSLASIAAVLAASVVAAPTAPAPRWDAFVEPYNQVFPALQIATANIDWTAAEDAKAAAVIGDPQGLIGATITASQADQRVRLVVRAPGLMAESTLEATLAKAGREYELRPLLLWDFDKLRRITQSKPDHVRFELFVDDKSIGNQTERVRVRAVNDAPYFVREGKHGIDMNWMFAAYVNEEHPLVEKILKEALASGVVDTFDGYQSRDEDRVYAQVFAIWHVLQRRGLRYSSIATGSNATQKVLSQQVRFLDQTWKNNQANCVDATVLLASVLRSIDIQPLIVLVPGHAFLGFYLDAQGNDSAFLETTMLGDVKRHGSGKLNGLADSAQGDVAEEASFKSFEAAIEEGFAKFEEAGNKFDSDHDPEYQIIPIKQARELGIMPIASD